MGRPSRKIEVCAGEGGFTLLELIVAAGLAMLVIVAVASLFQQMETSQRSLAARSDAKAQGELFSQRFMKLFRTRSTARDDKGFVASTCTSPGAKASCFDIYRHRSSGAGGERYRIKNICQVLSPSSVALFKREGLSLEAVATSVQSLCGFRCAPGSRPVVIQRYWPDASAGATRDEFWPRGRIAAATALVAGFCASRKSASEILVLHALGHLNPGQGRLTLTKRDLVLPTDDDPSQVEWLP